MAKFSYSRLEKIITSVLRKYHTKKLFTALIEALEAQARNAPARDNRNPPSQAAAERLMNAAVFNLKIIKKLSKEEFDKLHDQRKRCKQLMLNLESLSLDEWDELRAIKKKFGRVRSRLLAQNPETYNEDLISKEQERLKKKGKYYFNVIESWDTV